MSESEDQGDKPYEPSQKKLDDARKKGEVVRSADLCVAASYGGLLLCLLMAGAASVQQIGTALMVPLDQAPRLAALVFDGDARAPLGGLATAVTRAAAPWFATPALMVLGTILAQRGFTMSPSKLQFKLSRLSPLSNARNKYGRSGLFEFAKSFVKLVIYSACLGIFLKAHLPEMASLPGGAPGQAILLLADIAAQFILVAFVIALCIGGVDFLWQRGEHMRKHRMSDKEMRDEQKEAEGDPHMKNTRRSRAQDIALNQMMTNVPGADVVIVNPTHFAVALKWSRLPGEAPACVAKGRDEIAARIRELAIEAGVPLHSDPPTARALFATTKLGQQISPEHYRAVAAAIRFAEAMRRKARWRT
ncbi:flagellar type III secretion system protein FlhB [Aquicoccus sp. G2-2]|uniref:EscU/YscU/HrcU family type III secretion system export apparatus switch protein n=1 Tax=Aquicoccus sp. G2-2 TaxID=3092120 RepID=UPI002AE04D61|nr:flagellar type III secretion system protein FlhB [Aquicoccus sp. G2-2]MEA1114397.1 flagellar type III secretion system protein FlhB [Aquicoccus sp. G2-2]